MLSNLPLSVCTDSYKASHFLQYPDCTKMVAYGEFRSSFQLPNGKRCSEDDRFIFYGIRYIVENYLYRKWTMSDVEQASAFYKTHNAGYTDFPFPKDLFAKFVKENDGYFPIKLQALPEGTVAHIHTPVFQITAEKEYSRLVTYFETILCMVWYPTSVATLSRRVKDLIQGAFDKSVSLSSYSKISSRFHDFGFRACTSLEQSVIGGCAHLLNFTGSDTMSAAFYAQFNLNNGVPVAQSIPASEHSVMTSYVKEKDAIGNMIDKFGTGVYSVVMDSYDYSYAVNNYLAELKDQKIKKGGVFVIRPDSGDPVDVIIEGLNAGDKIFGSTVNEKGFKVIKDMGIIQGDGINILNIKDILEATMKAGYSVENVAFGMGGGLLQKLNRDTMSFAVKLSYIQYADLSERIIMKYPKSDITKTSLPGILKVVRDEKNVPVVYPDSNSVDNNNLLVTVYDNGPVRGIEWPTFDMIKEKVEKEWKNTPLKYNNLSEPLLKVVDNWISNKKKELENQ